MMSKQSVCVQCITKLRTPFWAWILWQNEWKIEKITTRLVDEKNKCSKKFLQLFLAINLPPKPPISLLYPHTNTTTTTNTNTNWIRSRKIGDMWPLWSTGSSYLSSAQFVSLEQASSFSKHLLFMILANPSMLNWANWAPKSGQTYLTALKKICKTRARKKETVAFSDYLK